jgi:putative spermidine/putrescine transport system substrate-binding protein
VRSKKTIAAFAVAVTSVALAAGCSSGGGSSPSSSSGGTDASTATSLAAVGGMSALVKAAKAEGELNVITLPANWANYGNIMKDFTAKSARR